MLTKQASLNAIAAPTEVVLSEDAVERLSPLEIIDRGIAEIDAGAGVDHGEVRRRLERSGTP
ncbi:MAG: hypothetical protein U0821_11270 [Chloroflexota bacterium]